MTMPTVLNILIVLATILSVVAIIAIVFFIVTLIRINKVLDEITTTTHHVNNFISNPVTLFTSMVSKYL